MAPPLWLAGGSPTSAPLIRITPILRYRLDNGLDVILVPDHRAPTVVLDIAYKAGVVNEPRGLSGFAHLFEHLMFTGTPAYPDVDAAYGAIGVELNASTWDDHTVYYARGMSSTLPFMLSVEADRMANQGGHITTDAFDIQRDVVINEIRQNVLDNVAGAAWEVFPAALFPAAHPYSRSVYGSIADLESASLDDAGEFFETYYAPNNAILAITGDFDIVSVQRLVGDTFGRIPRAGEVTIPRQAFAPTRARIELCDRVPTDMVFAGWSVPAIDDKDLSLLRLAAEQLGNQEYGILRRALVDAGLANGAWVHLQQGMLASRLIVQVSAADGVDAASVEAAANDAIADFLAAELDDQMLARARTRIVTDDRMANEDPLRLADNLLTYAQALDDPAMALRDDPVVAKASAQELAAASRRWLQPEQASYARVRPGGRGKLPALLAEASGVRRSIKMPPRRPTEIPRLPPGEPQIAGLPQAEATTLPNGVQLIHYRLPHASMAHIGVHSPVGSLAAPAGKEGIVELATAMAVRGAGNRPAADFGMASRDIGAEFDTQAEGLASLLSVSVPPDRLDAAVLLLADALLRPRFDVEEFEIAKAEDLHELALRESDLGDLATRYAEHALFPRLPGQAAIDRSIASTSAITRADAAAAFPRIFSPATATIHSVGPMALEQVADLLSPPLAGWTSSLEPYQAASREAVSLPRGKRVLVVPEPGATQVALYLAVPAPGPDDPGFAEALAVYRLLNYDFNSRINAVVREELAYTYGTDGGLLDDVRRGSALAIEASVEQQVAGAAIAEILRIVSELADVPVREDELERTRMAYLTALAMTAETGQGLFDEIWRRLSRGSSLEEAHRRRMEVVGLELEQVRRRAAALSPLDSVLIVAAGDASVIVPQLEAIGLVPDIVARTL